MLPDEQKSLALLESNASSAGDLFCVVF